MKHVLVTGANRGIGAEVTRQLLDLGFAVWAAFRPGRKLPAWSPAPGSSGQGKLLPLEMELTDPPSRQKACGIIRQSGEPLWALINNAGVYEGHGPSGNRQVLDCNVTAVHELTQSLRSMIEGRIINISSGMGILDGFSSSWRQELLGPDLTWPQLQDWMEEWLQGGISGWPGNAYSVSKALLNALTRIWHREWGSGQSSLDVLSICPGWVRTDMGGASAPRSVEKGAETPVWACQTDSVQSGLFYRDKQPIDW